MSALLSLALLMQQADVPKAAPLDAKAQAQLQKDIESDIRKGKEYAEDVDKELKRSEDAEMTKRVQRIGGQLAEIANRTPVTALWGDRRFSQFPYDFRLVQGKDVNAFSLPGGIIYVYEGLVKQAESDDELAGVLAHEIAHASLRHVATLQRESSKLQVLQIPLLLLTLLTGRPEALATGSLLGQAIGSGWSVKAEQAADYGGVQYMLGSGYDPTGILTFMERLARDERAEASVDWGIYRTHPPGRQRAEALEGLIRASGRPLRRSAVTTSFRTTVRPGDGTVDLYFGKRRLFGLAGPDALKRADEAAVRLNAFFDAEPQLYESALADDGTLMGRRQSLVRLTAADATAAGMEPAAFRQDALKRVRGAVLGLSYQIWNSR